MIIPFFLLCRSGISCGINNTSFLQERIGCRIFGVNFASFGNITRIKSISETSNFLKTNTFCVRFKIFSISALNPKILISKQQRLGFQIKGNQLEVGQEFENISSKIIEPGIPMLILKEVEIALGKLKRKMNFCLIGEEFWMVFR